MLRWLAHIFFANPAFFTTSTRRTININTTSFKIVCRIFRWPQAEQNVRRLGLFRRRRNKNWRAFRRNMSDCLPVALIPGTWYVINRRFVLASFQIA